MEEFQFITQMKQTSKSKPGFLKMTKKNKNSRNETLAALCTLILLHGSASLSHAPASKQHKKKEAQQLLRGGSPPPAPHRLKNPSEQRIQKSKPLMKADKDPGWGLGALCDKEDFKHQQHVFDG